MHYTKLANTDGRAERLRAHLSLCRGRADPVCLLPVLSASTILIPAPQQRGIFHSHTSLKVGTGRKSCAAKACDVCPHCSPPAGASSCNYSRLPLDFPVGNSCRFHSFPIFQRCFCLKSSPSAEISICRKSHLGCHSRKGSI